MSVLLLERGTISATAGGAALFAHTAFAIVTFAIAAFGFAPTPPDTFPAARND
ncbi:MAG: hypothetical protein LBT53_10005 [Puniceicoccales bacterium]|nr:hypothetical protein [Puniceicoccales bacterium]